MAQPNRISITIPQADHDLVMQQLAAIRTALAPYLIPSPQTTHHHLKMDNLSQSLYAS